ncbi:MAG: hypothetical protein DI534_06845 [Leifsonia xyli]|nr:MAG: hypothetical protein DI534_06845 [Leifsonia xyli]
MLIAVAVVALLAGCVAPAPSPAPSLTASGSADPVAAAFPRGAAVVYTNAGVVRIAAPDGSGDVVVTSVPPGEQLHPDWSPAGDAVAFAVDDSDGTRDIWVASDGGAVRRLVDCADPCAFTDDPAWSPDGTAIAFHRGVDGGGGRGVATLETVPVAGGAATVVATLPSTEYPFAPRWSPDGTRIVTEVITFASEDIAEDAISATRIAIIDVADGSLTEIPGAPVGAGSPDWSPDGTRILFSLSSSSTVIASDLAWIPPEGGTPTPLTDVARDGKRALLGTWTPDGALVIFDYETRLGDASSAQISTVSADGGEITTLFAGTHPRLRP